MLNIETLIKETSGMTPKQFEEYAESHGIFTEWDDVCVSDFNSGVYSVALPDYEQIVYAFDGSPISFTSL